MPSFSGTILKLLTPAGDGAPGDRLQLVSLSSQETNLAAFLKLELLDALRSDLRTALPQWLQDPLPKPDTAIVQRIMMSKQYNTHGLILFNVNGRAPGRPLPSFTTVSQAHLSLIQNFDTDVEDILESVEARYIPMIPALYLGTSFNMGQVMKAFVYNKSIMEPRPTHFGLALHSSVASSLVDMVNRQNDEPKEKPTIDVFRFLKRTGKSSRRSAPSPDQRVETAVAVLDSPEVSTTDGISDKAQHENTQELTAVLDSPELLDEAVTFDNTQQQDSEEYPTESEDSLSVYSLPSFDGATMPSDVSIEQPSAPVSNEDTVERLDEIEVEEHENQINSEDQDVLTVASHLSLATPVYSLSSADNDNTDSHLGSLDTLAPGDDQHAIIEVTPNDTTQNLQPLAIDSGASTANNSVYSLPCFDGTAAMLNPPIKSSPTTLTLDILPSRNKKRGKGGMTTDEVPPAFIPQEFGVLPFRRGPTPLHTEENSNKTSSRTPLFGKASKLVKKMRGLLKAVPPSKRY